MSVEPRSGSLIGGTVLTITGKFFSLNKANVKVTVGGKSLVFIVSKPNSTLHLTSYI